MRVFLEHCSNSISLRNGLFSSADRTLLLEAMIQAIPAPTYLQAANLALCAYGEGGSLLQSFKYDGDSTESVITALKTQELIDGKCPRLCLSLLLPTGLIPLLH